MKNIRQQIIATLWQRYRQHNQQMSLIENKLVEKGLGPILLDHFAIIDLPGPLSGITHLQTIFSLLGYIERGKDYLPEKQNDFLWMAEEDSEESFATAVLPQVVVADFRLEEMPDDIRKIIEHYASQAKPAPTEQIKQLLTSSSTSDQAIHDLVVNYLHGRDWPLPTIKEFKTVQAFNELLAWVLVFGRKPNHFTLSVHLLNHFSNLSEFHQLLRQEIQLQFNTEGGIIKGGPHVGIEQGSTASVTEQVKLADGIIELPTDFVEFVWRFPINEQKSNDTAMRWRDYFTGFIASQANRVVESLYA